MEKVIIDSATEEYVESVLSIMARDYVSLLAVARIENVKNESFNLPLTCLR